MVGLINSLCKNKKDSRHQEENGNQADDDRFYKDNTHIISETELHEHHGNHTGYRCQ